MKTKINWYYLASPDMLFAYTGANAMCALSLFLASNWFFLFSLAVAVYMWHRARQDLMLAFTYTRDDAYVQMHEGEVEIRKLGDGQYEVKHK